MITDDGEIERNTFGDLGVICGELDFGDNESGDLGGSGDSTGSLSGGGLILTGRECFGRNAFRDLRFGDGGEVIRGEASSFLTGDGDRDLDCGGDFDASMGTTSAGYVDKPLPREGERILATAARCDCDQADGEGDLE